MKILKMLLLTPRQSFALQNFATPLGKGVTPPSQANNLIGGVIFAMLAGLAACYIGVQMVERLFIAIPQTAGTAISAQSVARLNDQGLTESEFPTVISHPLTTYEIRQTGNITALNVNRNATLIGTNDTFPFVTGKQMTHGRFFDRSASHYRHQVAVLNEAAAFEFFGTIEATGNRMYIGNAPYSVVGVIDNGDTSNFAVYIPLQGAHIETIAANLRFNPKEHIINEWQQIGVTHERYHFVNFGILSQVVQNYFIIALTMIGVGFLVLGINKAIKLTKNEWHDIQIHGISRWSVCITIGGCAVVIILTATALALGIDAFERALVAFDSMGMLTNAGRTDAFAVQISQITRYVNISAGLFAGFLAVYFVLVGNRLLKSNVCKKLILARQERLCNNSVDMS